MASTQILQQRPSRVLPVTFQKGSTCAELGQNTEQTDLKALVFPGEELDGHTHWI